MRLTAAHLRAVLLNGLGVWPARLEGYKEGSDYRSHVLTQRDLNQNLLLLRDPGRY